MCFLFQLLSTFPICDHYINSAALTMFSNAKVSLKNISNKVFGHVKTPKGHLSFQFVIDYGSVHSDPGTILS